MKTSHLLIAIFAVAALIGLLNRMNPNGPPRPKVDEYVAPKPSVQNGPGVMASKDFGASSKDLYNKVIAIMKQRDEEAATKLMTAGLQTGDIIMFEAGDAIFVNDISYFSNLAQVRKKGEVRDYWTSLDAVEKR